MLHCIAQTYTADCELAYSEVQLWHRHTGLSVSLAEGGGFDIEEAEAIVGRRPS